MMKKILLIIIFSLLWLNVCYSQKLYPLNVGLGTNLRTGLNIAQVPQGRKLDINIGQIPDFNATIYLPYSLDYNIGTMFDLSYSTIGHTIKDELTGTQFATNISYLSISPSLFIEGFIAGFEIGIPVSSTIDGNFDEKNLNSVLYSLKLGTLISVIENDGGRLTFNIIGNFMLNGIYTNYPESDPLAGLISSRADFELTEQNNPRIFSLSLGITYFFNINY